MMNKKIMVTIIVLAMVIIGAILFVVLQPKKQQQITTSETQSTPAPAQTEPSQQQAQPTEAAAGKYAQYDAAAVASTPGRKVLFFHAAWCPQCRNLEKTILEGKIPSGMTIFKVNYDSASELRQKYGVTLQTTVIEVDNQGNALKKHVAYDDPTLPAVIKALGQ